MNYIDIKDHEKGYSISEYGKVFSKKLQRILKTDKTSGYERVILNPRTNKKRMLVHRLVALHFVDGYFDGAIVNHIDGDTLNNHHSNLEWCNQSHNLRHAVEITKTRDLALKSTQRNNSSGYIGVMKKDDVYSIQIRYKKKTIHTKYGFKTAIEGAKYRDKYLDDNNLPHTRSL